MKNEAKCLHAGYIPGNEELRVLSIVQSTMYVYDSAVETAAILDDPTRGLYYSWFGNPTVMAVEQKIAELEGGVGTMRTTSGQAATLLSILNICMVGDSIINTPTIYGGTINLFSFTPKKLGIECIYVNDDASDEEVKAAFKPNTKLVFGEIIANLVLKVFNIEKFANIAHEMGVPLTADNTSATPILCKPFVFGADIVIHSIGKYTDGHAVQIGGVIVDSGKFNWKNGKFPELTEPDGSYHGISYTNSYGNTVYIIKARMQLMRDLGVYPVVHSALLLNLGLETPSVRVKQYRENAMTVAKHLEESDAVESVLYLGLPDNRSYKLAKKYLEGCSSITSPITKGGRPAAIKFMDPLKLAFNEVHVANTRTCVLHPASEIHRQSTDEWLATAGTNGGMIRFPVGLENINDIIKDLDLALKVSISRGGPSYF